VLCMGCASAVQGVCRCCAGVCRYCAEGVQVLCCTPRRPSNSVAFYSAGVEVRSFIAHEGAVNRLAGAESGLIGAMQGDV